MTCYYPRTGYRSPSGQVVFAKPKGYAELAMQVPCGQCVGCRLDRARDWAVRMRHEASLHEKNIFVTLTYGDGVCDRCLVEGRSKCLPHAGALHLPDFQKFMKRLRKYWGEKVRFFHCGEYGEQTLRPHYHAILFGIDFADKKPRKRSSNGVDYLYVSDDLDAIWGHGHCWIGNVTMQSAGYVARYCLKKMVGPDWAGHYERITEEGEVVSVPREYATMSRRPGIGAAWFERYHSDVYPSDFVTVDGVRVRAPRFYDRLHQEKTGGPKEGRLTDDMEKLKRDRRALAAEHAEDQTPERLRVRETVKKAQISTLKRGLE